MHSLASLVLVTGVAQVLAKCLHALAKVTSPGRPCGGTQTLVALQEDLEVSPIAETCSPHTEVLHQSQVLHLVTHNLVIEHTYSDRESTSKKGNKHKVYVN